MFNSRGKKSPVNPDLYSPDQLVADKNANPMVGGVDWTKESSVSNPPVPPVILNPVKFDPSARYFERHPDKLIDKPGVKLPRK